MKESGIPWLEKIPEHWELKRLKYLSNKIIDTEHKTCPFMENGEYYVVRTSDVKNGNLNSSSMRKTNLEGFMEWTKRGIPEKDDVLLTREAPAGEACLVPDDFPLCLGQRIWQCCEEMDVDKSI
jgi:type I restriction enzyme S subunit